MRNFLLAFCLAFCWTAISFTESVQAQLELPSSKQQMREDRDDRNVRNHNFDRLKRLKAENSSSNPKLVRSAIDEIESVYRNKLNKEEIKMLAPSSDDAAKYSAFLNNSRGNAGLTRIKPDLGCADNPNVLVATGDCLRHRMPGAGSSYSFRTESYRIKRLADLTFSDGGFHATGILLHGILVGLGDIPLEQINLQTNGMKYLVDFQPAQELATAEKVDRELMKGVSTSDGFKYRRSVKAVDNMTYALRSVAYEGKILRNVRGITYDELDFDKRKDVIVVFRIVSRDAADGSVTILWKELSRKNAPEIKAPDAEKKAKENKFVAGIKSNKN